MKILAVDTSTSVAAVALCDGEKLLGEQICNNRLTHSAKLMAMVDSVLLEGETKPAEIDLYAVATGPGSFTGLRIGIAAVKGLASVWDKPVAAVTTLESLAENFPYCSQIICPMLDARNRLIYASAYRWQESGAAELFDVACYPVDEYFSLLERQPGDFLFCGDGAVLYREEIRSRLGIRAAFAPAGALYQRASSLCSIALRRAQDGQLSNYHSVVPTYFKASQPEREDRT